MDPMSDICAIVVIGRNEGPRLEETLVAARATGLPVTYVDSRSSDGSVSRARALDVDIVEMGDHEPLGAARARNLGARHVLDQRPEVKYIQFVDGDCLLHPDWPNQALAVLESDSTTTAVCGWTLEARPQRNVFHRMAQMEWQMGSVGEVPDFAGVVMMRTDAFLAAGGYDPKVVAGEDTELSSRIRQAGGRIQRIDAVGALHDINMSSPRQWWQRSARCGYAYAEIAVLHRHTDQLFLHEAKRTVAWGAVAPLAALALLRWSRLPLLLLGARYGASAIRAARSVDPPGATWIDRLTYGVGCVIGSLPGALGVAKFALDSVRGRHPSLIEYRRLPTTSPPSAA